MTILRLSALTGLFIFTITGLSVTAASAQSCTDDAIEKYDASIIYPDSWQENLEIQHQKSIRTGKLDEDLPERIDPQSYWKPVIPMYPDTALQQHLSGSCKVLLQTDAEGYPLVIEAACSNDIFEEAAIRAVERGRIPPGFIDGQPVPRYGVVYPLVFCLE